MTTKSTAAPLTWPLTTTAAAALTAANVQAMTTSQAATLTAADLNAMTAVARGALTGAQVAAIPAAALAGGNLSAMTKAAAAGISAADVVALGTRVASLSAAALSGLGAAAVAALTPAQVAALNSVQTAALTAAQINTLSHAALASLHFGAVAPAQTAGLSTATLKLLTAAQAAALTPTQTAALTVAQLNALTGAALTGLHASALTATQVAGLSTAALASLSPGQIASLTVAGVGALTATQAKSLSLADLAAFTRAQAAALTTTAFAALSAAQLGALIGADASAITAKQLAAVAPTVLTGLSTSALAALSTTQVAALTAADLNALSGPQLQALHLSALSKTTVAALTASAVGGLTGAQFETAIGGALASLTVAAVKGVTAAEIDALATSELGTLTASQLSALSSAAAAELAVRKAALNGDSGLLALFQSQVSGGAVSYNGLLNVLQAAASGGMTAGKFAALGKIAGELNAASGVSTSAYDQQIFNDVVNGNTANAYWTGGASGSVALGNLSSASSQTQVKELIGKWFLGTDLPQLSATSGYSYHTVNDALFGSSGSPTISDIEQGRVGDCYFMSALETTALQDPSLIKAMIQSNGNGTYGVDFQLNGQNDYVTVNNQLAVDAWGRDMAAATLNGDMWAALIEKAYVAFNTQTAATNYSGGHVDSYNTISGGASNGVAAITGQSMQVLNIAPGLSSATAATDFKTAVAAFQAGEDVMFGTMGNSSEAGNWVASHMFSVTGANAAAGTLTISNPWGPAAGWDGKATTFTATMAQLEAEHGQLFVATGKPALA